MLRLAHPLADSARSRRGALVPLIVTAGLLAAGCDQIPGSDRATAPAADYPVLVIASADDQRLLAGVKVYAGKRELGTTDARGTVRFSLTGPEGAVVPLTVKCPENYTSPEKPLAVGLRRMSPSSPAPRFQAQCVPMSHTLVVGIRAENGPNVPVMHLDEVIGETDEHGFAHVLLEVAPNESVSLKLETGSNPRLRPQNPTLTFLAGNRDEMILLEQRFTELKRVVKVRPKSVPQRL